MNSVEQIWNDYHSELRRFIGSQTRNAADAEDVLQNVFLKINARFETLKQPNKIRGWLFQIARNAATDFYRARRFEAELLEGIEPMIEAETNDQGRCFNDAEKCLLPMIDRLPRIYKTAVKLSELDGWTNKRVAETENVSLTAVKSRIRRGRRMFKKMLDDCCLFETDRRGRVIDCVPKVKGKICC